MHQGKCLYLILIAWEYGIIYAIIKSSEKQDKNINYSDTPPIDETKHWYKAAEHPAVYRPIKKPTTIRLDADVLEWLKSKGKGYQTRINKILREAMLDEIQR